MPATNKLLVIKQEVAMLKKNLIKEVSRLSGQTEKAVRAIHEATTTAVLTALAGGASVMLLGIGKLSVVRRGEKVARNIHTREVVLVPPRNVATLRASDAVHEAINPA